MNKLMEWASILDVFEMNDRAEECEIIFGRPMIVKLNKKRVSGGHGGDNHWR